MINRFKDEYYFLSNFYEIPVTYDGITYKNNEAAFQAQKTYSAYQISKGEKPYSDERLLFKELNASEAKKLGRKISLRPDWEKVKIPIMRGIVYAKFTQNPELGEKLINTDDEYLEEGNTWGDRIWGTVNGSGANNLGRILMEIREQLKDFDKGYSDKEEF